MEWNIEAEQGILRVCEEGVDAPGGGAFLVLWASHRYVSMCYPRVSASTAAGLASLPMQRKELLPLDRDISPQTDKDTWKCTPCRMELV